MARNGKYNNVKVKYDGYDFDSLAEMERYKELVVLLAAGQIAHLVVHPVYELQPSFKRDGKRIRAIKHEGDFEYEESPGEIVVEDVKGEETDVWKMKHKMFLYQYPDHDYRVIPASQFAGRTRGRARRYRAEAICALGSRSGRKTKRGKHLTASHGASTSPAVVTAAVPTAKAGGRSSTAGGAGGRTGRSKRSGGGKVKE